MSSSCVLSTERTNIPISMSLLHEQEYHNLCLMLQANETSGRRRAFSEKSKQKNTFRKQTSFSFKG
jgi:hypothetical protein